MCIRVYLWLKKQCKPLMNTEADYCRTPHWNISSGRIGISFDVFMPACHAFSVDAAPRPGVAG